MYTHEELLSAVREVGRDGKTFSVKDLRTQLGFDTRDKHEQNRFRRRLRAFEKAAVDELEKLGNNSYRLKRSQPPDTVAAVAPPPMAAASSQPPLAAAIETHPAAVAPPAMAVAPAIEVPPAPAIPAEAQAALREAPVPTSAPSPTASSTTASTAAAPRYRSKAASLLSRALSAAAAVSSNVKEHGPQLKRQLSGCLRSGQMRREAWMTLQQWAAPVAPLADQLRVRVTDQLHALRQRVSRRPTA
jgi:hypothetical protein